MSYWLVAVGVMFFGYALVSKRLSTTAITGPMVFVAAGVLVGTSGLGLIEAESTDRAIDLLLEATLAIVLFSDAAVINSTNWREEALIPGRLLLIGLPLTVIVGLMVAALMFTDLNYWEAGLVAAILAPTDAALGQAVISNPRVPQQIRQGLATESGLNDGIALTFVVIFLAGAEESLVGGSVGALLSFLANEIVLAGIVGVGVGWLGGWALVAVSRRDWISPTWLQIGALSIGVSAYGLAVPLGASGFIAAWLAGLLVGGTTRGRLDDVTGFSETLGTSMTMMSFLIFGAVLLEPAIENVTATIAVFAVLSLTLIRMLPVAASMIGSGLRPPTVGFLGWFGPRGLASIVLAGVVEASTLPTAELIVTIATITVGISVFAHGASSWVGSQGYADWWASTEARPLAAEAEAAQPTEGVPQRFKNPGMSA